MDSRELCLKVSLCSAVRDRSCITRTTFKLLHKPQEAIAVGMSHVADACCKLVHNSMSTLILLVVQIQPLFQGPDRQSFSCVHKDAGHSQFADLHVAQN